MDTQTPSSPMMSGAEMRLPAATEIAEAFAPDERRALEILRDRYERGGDALTARELARLDFVRWLYRSGRLDP